MAAPLSSLELLERTRRGERVDPESVGAFVRAWAGGSATDAQMAAWCMAACLKGLDAGATEALTRALIASGDRLELGRLGPTGDTHSTGGVGDTTTLVAAPLAASLGVAVAKMAGRGLAHTGGTVDKLEAIPGYRTDLPLDAFVRQVRDVGVAVIAQTPRLTPADGRLYALRDQTGTVESAGLIAASIMSKKIAGGAGAVALDVKAGAGAFFSSVAEARAAAALMASLAEPYGRTVRWMVTAMDQPLGRAVGNALEVREAALTLRGEGPADLRELALRTAAELAESAGVAPEGEGRGRAEDALDGGRALAMAERWVEAQGGDPSVWTDAAALPAAPIQIEVTAPAAGWIDRIDARGVGETARWLGAGRLHPAQSIDPVAGIELAVKVGDAVERGEPVARVHARDAWLASRGAAMLEDHLGIGAAEPPPPPLVLVVSGGGR